MYGRGQTEATGSASDAVFLAREGIGLGSLKQIYNVWPEQVRL
jgi:hypothetical protein